MKTEKKKLVIQEDIFEHMRLEAIDAAPRETCGIITSKDNIQSIYPIRNISADNNAFIMDPQELVDAFLGIRAQKAQIICIYHSHPNSIGTPSHNDIAENTFSSVVHLIWSLENKEWRCRAFCYTATSFYEINLEID